MFIDRLKMLSAISFIKPAIPKKAETGRNCLFVRVDEGKLTSLDADIIYHQPKFGFKDLEPIFDITKAEVSDIPVMSGDISSAVFGFKKSEKIDITFTGPQSPILFEQEDYKAILMPPVEAEEEEEVSDGQQEI